MSTSLRSTAQTTLSLQGKIALITGSASGIGKRIAEVFAQAGANIVIADLKLDNAQNTAHEIAASQGGYPL